MIEKERRSMSEMKKDVGVAFVRVMKITCFYFFI